MPPAGFEPAIPASERPQTRPLSLNAAFSSRLSAFSQISSPLASHVCGEFLGFSSGVVVVFDRPICYAASLGYGRFGTMCWSQLQRSREPDRIR